MMAEYSSVDNASEEVFDFVCGPCNVDGEVLQAKGYCSNCQDYLCELCLKTHIRPKPMRHHVLLDEKAMPTDKMATPAKKTSDRPICSERCEKHSGKIIEYYCQSHDFLGCTKCFISDNHKQCAGVVCIEDEVAGIYDSQEYTSFELKQQNLTKILSEISSSITQRDEDVILGLKRSKDDFKTFRSKFDKFLDGLEKNIDIKAKQIHDEQRLKLTLLSKDLEGIKDAMKMMKDGSDKKKKLSQQNESFIAMKTDLKKIKEHQDMIDAMRADIETMSPIVFKPDQYLEKSITSVKCFGTLLCKTNKAVHKVTEEKTDEKSLKSTTTVKNKNVKNDDMVFETLYHRSGKEYQCIYQSGMRFYLDDLGSKEWQPFPKRWYNEGQLVIDTILKEGVLPWKAAHRI